MLILKDPQRSKDQVVLPFLHFGSLFGVRVLKSDVGSRWAGGYRLSFGSLGISTSELSTFPSPSTLRSCILSLSLTLSQLPRCHPCFGCFGPARHDATVDLFGGTNEPSW